MTDSKKPAQANKLRAFSVSPKDDRENKVLAFATSHSQAKTLAKNHFQGVGYQSLRAVRQGFEQFDSFATAVTLVKTDGYLPIHAPMFYPAVTTDLGTHKPVDLAEPVITDESLVLPEIDADPVVESQTFTPKPHGFFANLVKKIFGQ